MARDWRDLFITGDDAAAASGAAAQAEEPERRRGFFRRLRENMAKTRQVLGAEIQATLFEGDLDADTWERLEEALIMADVGATTTAKVVGQLEQEAEGGGLDSGEALTARLAELLAEIARTGDDRIDLRHDPAVILMVGVNGTGKTTTLGKVAWHLRNELGKSVMLGRGRHVPRGGDRAAAGLGAARRRADRHRPRGLRPRCGGVGRDRPGPRTGRRRRADRHRGAAAHPGRPDGRADEGAPRDRAPDPRRAARDAVDGRRDDRPERAAPGADVRAGGRRSTGSC